MSAQKQFTELDKELQGLALVDWSAFVRLVGDDAITSAKVCILKSRGKSLNQIGSRLDITKNQAQYQCGKCDSALSSTLLRSSNE